MRDPLIVEAQFHKTSYSSVWSGDWITKGRRVGSLALCSVGPKSWYALPPTATKLWLVVSPYPDQGYLLWYNNIGSLVIGPREHPRRTTAFYVETQDWISQQLTRYPKFNFYLAMEVGGKVRHRLKPIQKGEMP